MAGSLCFRNRSTASRGPIAARHRQIKFSLLISSWRPSGYRRACLISSPRRQHLAVEQHLEQQASCPRQSLTSSLLCKSVSDSLNDASASDQAATKAPRVCVLGAGVVGLTTALRLVERFPKADITIFAEKFGGDTTTAGAAGVWQPYKLSETPEDLVNRWVPGS